MEISLQQLSDAGINPFAVKLLVESWLRHDNPPPVAFVFNGVKISIETAPVVVQALEDVARAMGQEILQRLAEEKGEGSRRSEPPPWVPG